MKYFIPLGLFIVLVIFLIFGLSNSDHVKEIPSPLINLAIPDFTLPTLMNENKTFSSKEMLGKVWILNVWASWCVSCRAEHEVIKRLVKKEAIDFIGLNYKDERQNGKLWLARLGNPYQLNAFDEIGDVGIDLGVYGVPETFVIDKKGKIRHKYTGPLFDEQVDNDLLPLIKKLQAEVM